MRKRILGCAVLLALAGGGSGVAARAAGPAPACCYTNPQFSGVCSVEPGEGESCATILAYLNDPQSQGKNYCGSTSIRGGWTPRKCDTAE